MLTYFENKQSDTVVDDNTLNRQHSMIPSFMVYHSLNNQGNNTDSNANVGIGFHKKVSFFVLIYYSYSRCQKPTHNLF